MKKILLILISLLFISFDNSHAELIQGSVAMTSQVPVEFFGDWKVTSVCTRTTDKELFNSKSVDIWTLARQGDIIILTNPLSGARAEIMVGDVKGKTVKFEKRTFLPEEETLETPVLTLQGDNFVGTDKIVIKTLKNGKLIKEDYVEFQVKGTKISGAGLSGIFGIF